MTLTIDAPHFGHDGELSGYLAYPARAGTPLPAIVVVQEAWASTITSRTSRAASRRPDTPR
jgi:dienelactone hydrolase